MSQRFDSILGRLRGLLLGAGWAAGVLFFWLGANDAFEGPKVQAAAVYALALAAVSWPLVLRRLPGAWMARRGPLAVAGGLLAALLASWVGAWVCLPGNLALPVERSLPVLAGALAGLVFLLEDPAARRRALFLYLAAHCVLLFYGLIQILDQVAAQTLHQQVDLIRWINFGEGRIYSTLGNPDYMAAHLTLVLAFVLALGWRRLDPRVPAQIAAVTLAVAPWIIAPVIYGPAVLGDFSRAMGPWLLVCAALFVAFRVLSARLSWMLLLGILSLLVLVAQGRGAWFAYGAAVAAMAAAGAALQGPRFFTARWGVLRWPIATVGLAAAMLGSLVLARAGSPGAEWTRQGARARILSTVDSSVYRLTHIFDRADDAQVVRRFYWQSALVLALDHPWVGVGYGNHAMLTARAQSSVWKRWDAAGDSRTALVEPHVELYTHNDFLQSFAETGAVGLAAFLLFWGIFLARSMGLARAGAAADDDRALELGLGLFGLATAFIVNAMTNFPWRVLATQQLCWLAFAVLVAARLPSEGEVAPAAPEASPIPKRIPAAALWIGVLAAAVLALFPLRWFAASLFFKAGDGYKDDPSPAVQVQGIPFYESAVRAGLSGTQRVELYLYLGSLCNVAQRPDQATAWFQKGLEAYPDFLEAWYNLGFTAQTRYASTHAEADRGQALAAYDRVLDIDPRAVNALNNEGNLDYQSGDLASAQAIFERLLRYSPDTVEARYNLAAVWLRKGDRDRCEEELKRVLQAHPGFAPAVQLEAQLRALPRAAHPR